MIGTDLSGYEILELAGSGGMGQVFRARDRRLGRTVAVKVLHPERAADPRLARRLLREARTCAALRHPGIVAVHSIGSQDGVDFIVMEWVSGHTLAEELARGPLPVARAVELAARLADALAAAHAAGIVHRDLKPHNVMIDERGGPKLVDFGVARLDAALADTIDELTAEGETPGTVAYMSPEQALGEAVDERSDVFALGVVVYEMLAGERPFGGETRAALVRRLLFAEPAPLLARRPEVSPALEAVVRRALAKRPEERYPRMDELAVALRAAAAAAPGGAPLPPPPRPAGRGWRGLPASRRRAAATAVVLGAPLALSAALLASAPPWRAPGAAAPAAGAAPRETAADRLPPTSFELYDEGMRLLARFDREGYVDAALGRFEAAVERSPGYAPAHVGLATAYWRQFRARRDAVWLRRAAESAERAVELAPLLLDARVARARMAAAEGDGAAARAALDELRRLHPGDAGVVAVLAEIAFQEGDAAGAAELYRQAIALRPGDWELHAELGKAAAAAGDLDAAERAFRHTLSLVRDSAIAHRNLGAVLHFQGRYAEAIGALQAAVTVQPSAPAYSNLGTAYYFHGDYGEAVEAFEAARELGANNYLLWGNLGDAYRQVPGHAGEAATCFARALQLLAAETAGAAPDAVRRSRRASYLAKVGRIGEALAEIEALQPLAAQAADVGYRAAVVYELAGRREPALGALAAALGGGYPAVEIERDPELVALREDVAFHRLMARHGAAGGA